MKKFGIFFILSLLMMGCNLFPWEKDSFTVEADQCEFCTVNPKKITVTEGDPAELAVLPVIGYIATKAFDIETGEEVPVINNKVVISNVLKDYKLKIICSKKIFTITVLENEGGTVSPTGKVSVPFGEKQKITATPDKYHKMGGFTVGVDSFKITPSVAGVSYSLEIVADTDYVAQPYFKKKEIFTITATCREGGTVYPSGVISVLEWGNINFSQKADPGWNLIGWEVDGVLKSPEDIYTLNVVQANHKVSPTYKKDPILWIFFNKKLVLDSIYIDQYQRYSPGEEILIFSPNGTYLRVTNNGSSTQKWVLNDPNIVLGCGICHIDVLTEKKVVLSYKNFLEQKVTCVYHCEDK